MREVGSTDGEDAACEVLPDEPDEGMAAGIADALLLLALRLRDRNDRNRATGAEEVAVEGRVSSSSYDSCR